MELRRVSYDHERSAAALSDRFGDVAWAARSERRLLTARPDRGEGRRGDAWHPL